MPHVVIKLVSGPSKEQLQEAAEQIAVVINKTLNKQEKFISVSVEEYAFNEWGSVYNEYIKDKDNLLIEPSYDPKMFG